MNSQLAVLLPQSQRADLFHHKVQADTDKVGIARIVASLQDRYDSCFNPPSRMRQTFFPPGTAMQDGAPCYMLAAIRRFRSYPRISGISRRYFVMNSFDGAMTMLGVVVGAHSAQASDPRIVIGAGLGASVAMGMSGFSGAYLTERAERMRHLRRLKKAMLSDMPRSVHAKASLYRRSA